ncbi:TonB family protein [Dyella kyungheensis]|uniref:TonB family protein n=1 Tax=Dyella kyungheensis TaxID=1242174 RepID=UPI003CF8ED76
MARIRTNTVRTGKLGALMKKLSFTRFAQFRRVVRMTAIAFALSLSMTSLGQVPDGLSAGRSGVQSSDASGNDSENPAQKPSQLAKWRMSPEDHVPRTHTRYIDGPSNAGGPWGSYVQGWVSHVEKVGRVTYPSEALRGHLSGNVLATTCILKNGDLASVDIVHSSGIPRLDLATIQTVRMAAPFAPLVSNDAGVEKLCITRTYVYGANEPGDGRKAPEGGR